ncbi:MAG: NACHT domain-containing protein [Chloroflexi bacterium]|nr:NACHT domain-containing protein [Chloroflexota bacterium]
MVDKHEGEHLQHVQLKYLIDKHFNRDDLRSLTFDIGVNFDHLREAGLLVQIEELLLLCLRQGRDQALLAQLVKVRPNVAWPTSYSISSIFPDLDTLRNDALNHAKNFTDRKSQILKPRGELPKLQKLFVTFHDKNINYRFSKKGSFEPEDKLPPPMLLSEVTKRDQRILLLGDLGTGKSTMVGLFVNEIIIKKPKTLALLIPASANTLKVPARATIQDMLNGISAYLNNHISIRTPPIEFRNLLDTEFPIYVIIDGLDEISSRQAASLLSLLHETTSHYPNLWVVTTGRPVELRGVNHQNWQIVTTLPLQDNEKLQLFQAESVANGLSSKDAKKEADQLLTRLKNNPTLNSLATTPLATRLLYDRLLTTQFDASSTLGDLLYDLLQERLGRWAQSDQKTHTFEYFEKEFPDELARIYLFGEFALHIEMAENLPKEQARLQLRRLLEPKVSEKTDLLAKEAVEYLIQSGIVIIEDNQLRYAIQPLFEFLTGFGLAERWIGKHSTPDWLQLQHWRIVSFAATVIRRLGATNELRSHILNYLETLLLTDRNIPAACYIIVELQDEACAFAFIDHVSQMGMRPLTYFGDEKEQSTRAIAMTIKLAGQKGFDWFYEHYLDPRYPVIHTASGLLDDVFEQWVYISQDSITDYERSKLQKLVRPHIVANTHQTYSLLPALAVLMPDAFTPKETLWMIKKYLGRGLFPEQAETYFIQEFQKGNERLVNNALLQIANQGHEMAKSAAWLWLSLNPDERPHALILKTLLSAYGRSYLNISHKEYLSLCEDRVGEKQWHQFLRWCLFHKNDRLAAGAAIELYALGEQRLSILGKSLLKAMHDGGYFELAEETLHQIVKTGDSLAIEWLANQIAETVDGYDHAHSGWWRIFLSELPSIGDAGPDLLAGCVGGVGPYLLPRYPEVRLLFRDLLSGPDGDSYRARLHECLNHINPAVRHGAAMILITCNPQDEPLALENVIKLRHRKEFGSWGEWESFCLNLSFSPQVLEQLKTILPALESSVKVLALAILYRNNIELASDEFTELVTSLLKSKNRLLDVHDPALSVFADPQSLPILTEIINQEPNSEAAAHELLNFSFP